MQYGEGRLGRIFVLRLEEGERLNDTLEAFAREQGISRGLAVFLGGAGDQSRMVVGPEANRPEIVPLLFSLSGAQEVLAVGTLFPDEEGAPVLHMHAAAGREGKAHVGCTRAGVNVWLVGEVVLLEILGDAGVRRQDPATGFQLLRVSPPGGDKK
jgi:predicted DNA-binding protein with PD1-like motif